MAAPCFLFQVKCKPRAALAMPEQAMMYARRFANIMKSLTRRRGKYKTKMNEVRQELHFIDEFFGTLWHEALPIMMLSANATKLAAVRCVSVSTNPCWQLFLWGAKRMAALISLRSPLERRCLRLVPHDTGSSTVQDFLRSKVKEALKMKESVSASWRHRNRNFQPWSAYESRRTLRHQSVKCPDRPQYLGQRTKENCSTASNTRQHT